MINYLKKMFSGKPKPFLIDNYRIVPAFELKGVTYYMHEDPLNTATGRGLTAMMFMEEILMRCNVSYLKDHVAACETIFNDPKQTNLPALIRLNNNLKERVNFLVALPEHVYKLASVVFFTKEESPYYYDAKFNEKKIKQWQESEGMYAFFLQTPLKTLVPFLVLPEESSKDYLIVQEKINQLHLSEVSKIISKSETTTAI